MASVVGFLAAVAFRARQVSDAVNPSRRFGAVNADPLTSADAQILMDSYHVEAHRSKRQAPPPADHRNLSRNPLGRTFVSVLGYKMERQALETHSSSRVRTMRVSNNSLLRSGDLPSESIAR